MNAIKCIVRYLSVMILAVPLLLLASCSAVGSAEEDYGNYEKSAPEAAVRSMVGDSALMESEVGFADESPAAVAPRQDNSPQSERKRVYNGSAGIVVDDAEATRQNLENAALDSGGYIESSYIDYVIIRVPAERFEEVFELVLNAGRVDYSRVETVDVTEAFSDIDRRLITARNTRERLYVLLEQSTDSAERAKILREIGRLTEEITSLQQQLDLLTDRISFSRITVQLIPRNPVEVSRQDIPFGWIAYLDPLMAAGNKLKANAEIDLGPEWAVFSKESVFLAENGEREQLVISTVDNDPKGDAEFWSRALEYHLSPFYAESTEREIRIGERTVAGIELVSKDRDPFRYYVGVIPDGKDLHVVEIFMPDAARGLDSIAQAMEEGRIR